MEKKSLESKIEKLEKRIEREKELEPERIERIKKREEREEEFDRENSAYLESFDVMWGDSNVPNDQRRYQAVLEGNLKEDREEAKERIKRLKDKEEKLKDELSRLESEENS